MPRGWWLRPGYRFAPARAGSRELCRESGDGVTTALGTGSRRRADVDRWYGEREGKALINFGASGGHIAVRMVVMHDPGDAAERGPRRTDVANAAELGEISALLEKGLTVCCS